jgi:mono/diheme cytochrome c family protein
MSYKKLILALALVLLLSAGLLLACGSETTDTPQAEEPETAPEEKADGEALLQERCTSCHGLDRTTSATKTREEWEKTVTRMVQKGAELNEQEMSILIDYLAETYGP